MLIEENEKIECIRKALSADTSLKGIVYMMLVKESKILLLRRFNTGYADGMYTLPSGHIEKNESIYEATKRETFEEVGVTVIEEEITLSSVSERKTNVGTFYDFFSIATNWDKEPYIAEPNKCDEVAWYDIHDLPKKLLPYVRIAIEHYLNNKDLQLYTYKEEE